MTRLASFKRRTYRNTWSSMSWPRRALAKIFRCRRLLVATGVAKGDHRRPQGTKGDHRQLQATTGNYRQLQATTGQRLCEHDSTGIVHQRARSDEGTRERTRRHRKQRSRALPLPLRSPLRRMLQAAPRSNLPGAHGRAAHAFAVQCVRARRRRVSSRDMASIHATGRVDARQHPSMDPARDPRPKSRRNARY